jgi:uncharacterized protein (TIGR03435 family)
MKFAIAGALLCCVAWGQQPAEKLAFEVASIKPADPSPMGQMRINMSTDAGMLRYTNVSLKDCIRVAYRVKDFQVEGPDWIGDTRFNITAKLPEGASEKQVPEMLQTLLAERFKLTLHRDTKEHAIYALVAEKGGPKLKPAEVPTGEAAAPAGSGGRGGGRGNMMMMMGPDGVHVKAASATLAGLGEMMSRFTDRPIVDMTGIQGQYDFDLAFSPESMRGMPGGGMRGLGPGSPGGEGHPADAASEGGGTIFDAVQKYGLKLEARKAPMEILIVDHMERAPTEN